MFVELPRIATSKNVTETRKDDAQEASRLAKITLFWFKSICLTPLFKQPGAIIRGKKCREIY